MEQKCKVDGCHKPYSSKGYCTVHYARVRRTGSTETHERLVGAPLEDRLWFRSVREGGCWVSQRALTRRVRNGEGYPGIRIGDQMVPVHLASYRHFKGEPTEGWQVHHECDNKRCWNPDHLVALTALEHKRRHHKAECINGHALEGGNVKIRVTKEGWEARLCRACIAAGNAQRIAERSAERAQRREAQRILFMERSPTGEEFCRNGHALTPDNIYTRPNPPEGWNARECKSCRVAANVRLAEKRSTERAARKAAAKAC